MTVTRAIRSFVILVGSVLLFCVAPCVAQDIVSVKVDDFVKSEVQKQRIPGVSLAVVKDGQIVLAKGYGFANVEHQAAVKPETIFQSGSVGKQFTAAAVMMLVEEGKINLDEKIGKYLGNVPENWKNIYHDETGALQISPVSWEKEANYRLPVSVWQKIMDLYYPNSAWLNIRRDVFGKLQDYKMRNALPSWEQALEKLLPAEEGEIKKSAAVNGKENLA